MKKRLTVNVDADLIAAAKRHAREHGVSLSSLVEESLREMAAEDAPAAQGDELAKAWAARWRAWFSGELPPPARSLDPRYRYLDEGMGQSYGVRWGDDDQPLEHVRPPTSSELRPHRRKRANQRTRRRSLTDGTGSSSLPSAQAIRVTTTWRRSTGCDPDRHRCAG